MQNQKVLSIFIFLPILVIGAFLDLFGQMEATAVGETEKSVFSQKPKPPALKPEKRSFTAEMIPAMEPIPEQIPQIDQKTNQT